MPPITEIPVDPFVMQESVLSINQIGYSAHVSSVEFVPTSSAVTWKGLAKGSTFTGVGSATWACNLGFAQDWASEESLSNFLLEHEGETLPAHFEPVDGGAGFDATIIVAPGSIGGSVDAVGVSTVSLGVKGKPQRTVPAGA